MSAIWFVEHWIYRLFGEDEFHAEEQAAIFVMSVVFLVGMLSGAAIGFAWRKR